MHLDAGFRAYLRQEYARVLRTKDQTSRSDRSTDASEESSWDLITAPIRPSIEAGVPEGGSVGSDEPRTLTSLLPELLTLVAEELDPPCLARFASASTVCLAAAHGELRAALRTAVQRCLEPGAGPVHDALVLCPYFHLPDLTAIPEGGFRGCTSLTKLTLPASIVTIHYGAFYGCTALKELTLSTATALTFIACCAFEGCTSLTKLTFPDALVKIGCCSFSGCTSLTSITLPAALPAINDDCFSGCTSLVELSLPVTVTTIGEDSFAGCTSLTKLTLPAALTAIGNGAFRGCPSLCPKACEALRAFGV